MRAKLLYFGERILKRIFTVIIIGILCLSAFSMFGSQVTKAADSGPVNIMPTHLPWKLSQSAAVWDGTNAYIFGGGNTTGATDRILRYNPTSDQITIMSATLPDHVTDDCAIWNGRCAFIFGGWTGQPIYSNKIVRYDPTTDTVTVMSAKLPTYSMSAVWDGTYAYLFGGYNGYSYYNHVLRYNPATDQLTTMNAKFPIGIKWTSAVWAGTYAYIFGGNKDYDTATDQIFRYDPVADSFTTLTAKLPEKLYVTSAVWTGTYALIFGGSYKGGSGTQVRYYDTIIKFDPTQDSTTVLTQTLPTPRRGTSAIWDGNNAYIFGGDSNNIAIDEIVKFTPTKHFDPTIDSFSFENKRFGEFGLSENVMSFLDVANFISTDPVYQSVEAALPGSASILIPVVYTALVAYNEKILYGHCYGMSYLVTRWFNYPTERLGYPSSTVSSLSIQGNNELHRLIDDAQQLQVLDFYTFVRLLFVHQESFQWSNLKQYTSIKELVQAGTPTVMGIFDKDGYLGQGKDFYHAVVVYEIDSYGSTDTLLISDPNKRIEPISFDTNKDNLGINFRIMAMGITDRDLFDAFLGWLRDSITLWVRCPVQLHVYDSAGRHVGLNATGKLESGFQSIFFETNDSQLIFVPHPSGDYTVKLIGTGSGAYNLTTYRALNNKVVATNVTGTIESNQVAEYVLIQTGEKITLQYLPPSGNQWLTWPITVLISAGIVITAITFLRIKRRKYSQKTQALSPQ